MNNWKLIITAISIGLVAIVSFQNIPNLFPDPKLYEEIDNKIALWLANKPAKYTYIIREGCMMFMRSYQVIDIEGSVEYFDLSENPLNSVDLDIMGLFKRLKQAKGRAEKLEVQYNALGYPESIKIDWKIKAHDDECFIIIEDYAEIKANL